jgi:hypothetical protein
MITSPERRRTASFNGILLIGADRANFIDSMAEMAKISESRRTDWYR